MSTAPAFSASPTAARMRAHFATPARRPFSGQAARPATPAPSPAIPVIPLGMLEEMTAAGATPDMIMIACRWVARLFAGRATPATDATLRATKPVAGTSRPKSSTERSRAFRAKKRALLQVVPMQRPAVAPVSPAASLSLIDNNNISEEREDGAQRCNDEAVAPVALAETWKPDDRSLLAAVECLGEAGADVLTANFVDHYASRPHDLRPPAVWQATYRKWARSERKAREGPPRLPLMRPVETGPPLIFVPSSSPAWDAHVCAGHKKSLITYSRDNRAEGWWFPTTWPPEQRKESG